MKNKKTIVMGIIIGILLIIIAVMGYVIAAGDFCRHRRSKKC